MTKLPVAVCRKVQFDPFNGIRGPASSDVRKTVTGTVIAVYPAHKWFSVSYGRKYKVRTSFKFCDIGDGVEVLG